MKRLDMILTGVLSVVGLADNPFSARVAKFRSRTIQQSFAGDIEKLANDFTRVYERKKVEISKKH